MTATKAQKMTKTEMAAIHAAADALGRAAAEACRPTPMLVYTSKHPLGRGGPENVPDPDRPMYLVPGGACGFAWVTIHPGNGRFANWLRKQGLAKTDAYRGGVCYWVDIGGQSMELKMAYAEAYAEHLRWHGISAYAGSRMD